MKTVKKIIGAVIAMVCSTGAAMPISALAEGVYPDDRGISPSYNTADINRNGTVDLMDLLSINGYVLCNRYVANTSFMDTNRNRVVSYADVQHVGAKMVENSYVCNVDGSSISFTGGTSSTVYTPSEQITSWQYYRHVYSGNGVEGDYTLTMQETSFPSKGEDPRTVFGDDSRVPEYSTDMKTGVCYTSSGGTGFVVGDHTIATAAHCVRNNSGWVNNLYVQFPNAANVGNTGAIGCVDSYSPKYYAVQAHVDKTYNYYCENNYPYEPKVPYDYALITVSEDLSNRYHFNLGIPYDVYNTNYPFPDYNLYITGYPGDKVNISNHYLYTGNGNMYLSGLTSEDRLRYDTDMMPGNSGSPVYIKESYDSGSTEDEINTVVGINVAQNSSFNSGVIMTPIRMKFYLKNSEAAYN